MNTGDPFLSLNALIVGYGIDVIFETFVDNEIEQLDGHDSLLLIDIHQWHPGRGVQVELTGYKQKRHDKEKV